MKIKFLFSMETKDKKSIWVNVLTIVKYVVTALLGFLGNELVN